MHFNDVVIRKNMVVKKGNEDITLDNAKRHKMIHVAESNYLVLKVSLSWV